MAQMGHDSARMTTAPIRGQKLDEALQTRVR
jgi:hypothetical protein